MNFEIEKMSDEDWYEVREIYREGILTGNATFETMAPAWELWDASHLPHSRLVARSNSAVVGWAALSPVSSRCIYGGVAEVSVYVGEKGRGQGLGNTLLKVLIESSEDNNLWTLQAGIFPENTASRLIHLRNGFREIGYRERIGKQSGFWRDNIILERRSKVVGTD